MIRTGKIPDLIDPRAMYTTNGQEAWRVLGIMAEFAAATERLQGVRPAVSMFGSARIKPGNPFYEKTERIARLLSDAGFAVISGGGPGLMEAANRGAHAGKSPSIMPTLTRTVLLRSRLGRRIPVGVNSGRTAIETFWPTDIGWTSPC